jgi:hypothetical protein
MSRYITSCSSVAAEESDGIKMGSTFVYSYYNVPVRFILFLPVQRVGVGPS